MPENIRKSRLRKQLEGEELAGVASSKAPCNLKNPNGCRHCQSSGYKLITKGAYVGAELCSCVTECAACFGSMMVDRGKGSQPCSNPSPKRIVSLFNASEIPARYKEADFACFTNFTGNAKQVVAGLQKWIVSMNPEGGPGLILGGPVGVGKTFLLAAIAKHLCRRGVSVKFVDFHRLLSVIRATYSTKVSEEQILGPLIDADVLLIDELGKGRNNDWEQEKLDQIVMGRYNQNKIIVASTNYSLKKQAPVRPGFFNAPLDEETNANQSTFSPDVFESLEKRVGKRIFSRLTESSLMVELEGEDFRRRLRPNSISPEFSL